MFTPCGSPKVPAPKLSLRKTEAIIERCLLLYVTFSIDSDDDCAGFGTHGRNVRPTGASGHETSGLPFSSMEFDSTALKYHNACSLHFTKHGVKPPQVQASSLSSSLPNMPFAARSDKEQCAEALPCPSRSPPSIPPSGLEQTRSQGPIRNQDNERANRQSVFQPLEDYIIGCFRNSHNLNGSFAFPRAAAPIRSVSEGTLTATDQESRTVDSRKPDEDVFELDAKTLLLADVAENGSTCRALLDVNTILNQLSSLVARALSSGYETASAYASSVR